MMTPHAAAKYFSLRDGFTYDHTCFHQFVKSKEKITLSPMHSKGVTGGGKKPTIGDLEEIIGQPPKLACL